MKKLVCMLMLIPFLGMSQSKNVLTGSRYFTKPDKTQEFEKAMASHTQKFHKGDWKWRVWTIESGPDAGGYMITEGPSDWATLDGRGDLGADHMMDWNKNISPLITSQYENGYFTFQPDQSTVQLTDYADKIVINHMFAKPGKVAAMNELINKLKKVWEADKESVAVYSMSVSGDPGFITVTRLRGGLKELADGYHKPMAERFTAIYGPGSWDSFLKDYADAVEKRWSELLTYKADLSSK